MVFENISIEFHSLKTYRMQNSEAKQSTNTWHSEKFKHGYWNWEMGINSLALES